MNRIQLKSLKVHNDMSEETTCFSATIYVDGKKVGDARNDGGGGSDLVHIDRRKMTDADFTEIAIAECKRLGVFERANKEFEGLVTEKNEAHLAAEFLFSELREQAENDKWCKRNHKTKVLFRTQANADAGEWQWIKVTKKSVSSPHDNRDKVIAHIMKKYDDVIEIYGTTLTAANLAGEIK